MKLSGKQLEMALNKMKYAMVGYRNDNDFVVEISMSQEDPGTGAMVACLTLLSTKQPQENEETDKVETMSIEIYPASESQDPRVSKTESYKITEKNRY